MDWMRLARGLGWFSIGLGTAELLAARPLDRFLGTGGRSAALRVFGLREIATGVGILASRNPAPWVWARVGGDVLDLAALGAALSQPRARPAPMAAAVATVAAATVVDTLCAARLTRRSRTRGLAALLPRRRSRTPWFSR